MAGVTFLFSDFPKLVELHMGLSQRIDENRAESFTLLYCDFSGIDRDIVEESLKSILRNSDAIASYKNDYFFTLPYTDKYGAKIVAGMFSDFFAQEFACAMVSYPRDGESVQDILELLKRVGTTESGKPLLCLDGFLE